MNEKVLNDKPKQEDSQKDNSYLDNKHDKTNDSISALDWGLQCAYKNRKNLFFLSLAPALIESLVGYSSFSRVLSPQEMFLAFVAVSLISSWLITSSSLVAFYSAKNKEIDFFDLSATSFVNLPKTLLCYISIMGVLIISFYLQPLLLFFVFLIWAPVFCIAEIIAEKCSFDSKKNKNKANKEKGRERESGEKGREKENFFNKKTVLMENLSLFTNKTSFELGFARSLNLGTRNIFTTFHSALLIWVANVVPAAVVFLILPPSLGFYPEVIKVFISSFAFAFTVCAVSGAFILLLSDKSLSELGISNDDKLILSLSEKPIFSLNKNYFASFALSILAIGSTFLFFDHVKKVKSVPNQIKAELQRADIKNDRLFVSLELLDEKKKFRWLEQQNFRLKIDLKEEINDKNLIVPVATKIENPKKFFSSEPLVLNLEFDQKTEEGQGFEIYYTSMFDKPKMIYRKRNSLNYSKKAKSKKVQKALVNKLIKKAVKVE